MFDELGAENAKLVADLDAYEKELGPKLAQKELDRQNRIAGLQTELEAYREIAKLRGPRAEKERQRSHRQGASRDRRVRQDSSWNELPKWEASQKKKTRWYPLEACEMGATYRAKFTRQPDGSIFVDGDKAKGAYRVVAPLPLDKVTGIRLDALADDRLPGKGPGRGTDGNFVVTEFAAHLLPAAGPDEARPQLGFLRHRRRLARTKKEPKSSPTPACGTCSAPASRPASKPRSKHRPAPTCSKSSPAFAPASRSRCSGPRPPAPNFEDARTAHRSCPPAAAAAPPRRSPSSPTAN